MRLESRRGIIADSNSAVGVQATRVSFQEPFNLSPLSLYIRPVFTRTRERVDQCVSRKEASVWK